MKLFYLWPLALLVLLPVIVILYLIRQKAVDRKVSSVFLWKEAYRNQRADTPWEKLRHNLLMYLQLLAMGLLIFAMTAPFLAGRSDTENFHILIIDRSASMGMEYEEGKIRLEKAKEEAIRYVEGLDRKALVTVIAADDAGTILINASENRDAVEEVIRELEPTLLPGDASSGLSLARSLAELYPEYELTAFTDTPVEFGGLTGARVDVSSEVDNVSVDLVSHTWSDELSVLVKTSNHSLETDYRGDLSLYLEGELAAVQTVEIGRRSGEVFYFTLDSIPAELEGKEKEGLLLTAVLSGKDALAADNEASELAMSSQEGKVLLVTERNTFLEQALKTNEELTVFLTDTAEAVEEGYGIYIFDGIFPETLPESGAVFLLNAPGGSYDWLKPAGGGSGDGGNGDGGNGMVGEATDAAAGGRETAGEVAEAAAGGRETAGEVAEAATGGRETDGEVVEVRAGGSKEEDGKEASGTQGRGGYLEFSGSAAGEYLDGSRIGVGNWYTYERPAWAESFLKDSEGNCVGFLGTESGRRVAVLGFDLHRGNFVLQTQFPIFVFQITEKLLEREPAEQEIANFPVQESGVMTSTAQASGTGNSGAAGTGLGGSQAAGTDPVLQMKQAAGIPLRNYLLAAVLVLLLAITVLLLRQGARGVPVLRAIVAMLLLLAMLDLTVREREHTVTTVYLVDVSDSFEAHREEAEQFVREAAKEKRPKDKTAVVAFGGDARVEQFVSRENLFRKVETAPTVTATNLERAVQTGLALLPDGAAGRIVLLTDGGETDGDVGAMASGLAERGVDLQVVEFGEAETPENYVSRMEIPSDVQVGEQFLITVQIESNCRTTALISLYEGSAAGGGEKLKGTKEVELSSGTNQFIFTDTRTEEGLVTYRAVLESAEDGRTVNNQYTAFTKAEAASRILVLEDQEGESEELKKVLEAAGVQAEVRPAASAPSTLLDLSVYAAVVLLDVPVRSLPEGFMANVESYVEDYGGGLITTGGSSSYALGGYRETVLEEVLPVTMDLKQDEVIPELSMIYVVDQSGSMGEGVMSAAGGVGADGIGDKLGVAKASVAEAVKSLREIDRVGILSFDDRYEWVLPVTSAEDQETIGKAVSSIQSGGGTSIYPALEEAVKKLEEETSGLKHIVLLTDGQDSYGFYGGLLKRIEEDGITLSTVAIGEDSDTKLLETLAEGGNGRYYYSDRLSELPSIFAEEIYLSMGEFLVNREFIPVVSYGGDLLTGVWENGMYPLLGYVAATPKDLATVYLESDTGDPILSGWQYGLGRTLAFQPDAVGNWTAYYGGQPEYAALWRNMLDWVRTELSDPNGTLAVETQEEGGKLVYRTDSFGAETSVHAVYTDTEGNSRETELTAVAPGVYESDLTLAQNQAYSLILTKKEGETIVAAQTTGIAMQYGREYQFADRTGLEQLIRSVGGRMIRTPSDVEKGNRRTASEPKNLSLLFLSLAAAGFLADIILRRFAVRPFCAAAAWYGRKRDTIRKTRENRRNARKAIRMAGNKSSRQQQEEKIRNTAPLEYSLENGSQGTEKQAQTEIPSEGSASRRGQKSGRNSERKQVRQTEQSSGQQNERPSGRKQRQENLLDTSALLKKKEERKW